MGKPWKKNHDPLARPLGCNGRYGSSGAKKHRHAREKVCRRCLTSESHYLRERRRGAAPLPRHREMPKCGTPEAARRHQRRKEPMDWDCKVALSEHRAALYRARVEREHAAKVAAARRALVELAA